MTRESWTESLYHAAGCANEIVRLLAATLGDDKFRGVDMALVEVGRMRVFVRELLPKAPVFGGSKPEHTLSSATALGQAMKAACHATSLFWSARRQREEGSYYRADWLLRGVLGGPIPVLVHRLEWLLENKGALDGPQPNTWDVSREEYDELRAERNKAVAEVRDLKQWKTQAYADWERKRALEAASKIEHGQPLNTRNLTWTHYLCHHRWERFAAGRWLPWSTDIAHLDLLAKDPGLAGELVRPDTSRELLATQAQRLRIALGMKDTFSLVVLVDGAIDAIHERDALRPYLLAHQRDVIDAREQHKELMDERDYEARAMGRHLEEALKTQRTETAQWKERALKAEEARNRRHGDALDIEWTSSFPRGDILDDPRMKGDVALQGSQVTAEMLAAWPVWTRTKGGSFVDPVNFVLPGAGALQHPKDAHAWFWAPARHPRQWARCEIPSAALSRGVLDSWAAWVERDGGREKLHSAKSIIARTSEAVGALGEDGWGSFWREVTSFWRPLWLPGMDDRGVIQGKDMTPWHFEQVEHWSVYRSGRWWSTFRGCQSHERAMALAPEADKWKWRPATFAEVDAYPCNILDDPRMDGVVWMPAADVTQAMLGAWPVWHVTFRSGAEPPSLHTAVTIKAWTLGRQWDTTCKARPLRLAAMNERGEVAAKDMTSEHFRRVKDWQWWDNDTCRWVGPCVEYVSRWKIDERWRPSIFQDVETEQS